MNFKEIRQGFFWVSVLSCVAIVQLRYFSQLLDTYPHLETIFWFFLVVGIVVFVFMCGVEIGIDIGKRTKSEKEALVLE